MSASPSAAQFPPGFIALSVFPPLPLLAAVGGGAAVDPGYVATSSDYVMLVAYLVLAIGFSFYCSVAEATLLSISPSFVATLGRRKTDGTLLSDGEDESLLDPGAVASANKIGKLKDNVDRPLAAILSLNTIAHTIGAAGVGAQAAKIWNSNENIVAIAGALMTLAILVLSEIIPKTIGALYWRKLAGFIATTVNWLIIALYPLVWMSELLTKILSGGKSVHAVTSDEFAAMADLGLKHGIIEEPQSRMLGNLMRLRDITASDIRTPRPVVIAASQNESVDSFLSKHDPLPVSRVPIHEDDIDKVTGMVLRSDLLKAKADGAGDRPLADFRRDVPTIPEGTPLLDLLERLTTGKSQMAVVVDEFGGTDGVVTLEDLTETLFGMEIVDEHDTAADLQARARAAWKRRASKVGLPMTDAAETGV